MTYRIILIAMASLVSCQALAQVDSTEAVPPLNFWENTWQHSIEPQSLETLKDSLLSTATQPSTNPFIIKPDIVKQWLEAGDPAAWNAIQQGRPTTIDFQTLFGTTVPPLWITQGGLDPFAFYDPDGKLAGIGLWPIAGEDPTQITKAWTAAREAGEQPVPLDAKVENQSVSSRSQKIQSKLYEAGQDICDLVLKPEQMSLSIGGGVVFVYGALELTFRTDDLCGWYKSL